MRQVLLAMSTFVLTVAWILVFVTTVPATLRSAPTSLDSEDVATARAFYDAVNTTVVTADDSKLDTMASETLIDENANTYGRSGREQLTVQIETLRHLTPPPRIDVRLAATGDRMVVAHVEMKLVDRQFIVGVMPSQSGLIWPAIETLRIANGQVVERTYRSTGLFAWTQLREETLDLEIPFRTTLEAHPWTVQPGASTLLATGETPAILQLGSGLLEISLHPSASGSVGVYRAGSGNKLAESIKISAGDSVEMQPGELAIVPSDSMLTLRNTGLQLVTASQLSFFAPMDPSELDLIEHEPKQSSPGQLSSNLPATKTVALTSSSRMHVGLLEMSPLATISIDPDTEVMRILTAGNNVIALPGDETSSESVEAFSGPLKVYTWEEIDASLRFTNTGPELTLVWIVSITAA